MKNKMTECSIELFNQCVPYFESLKDQQRQEIIVNLSKHKELSVSELVDLSSLSMPAVSHHLKLLSSAGLVTSYKKGTKRYYRLAMAKAISDLEELIASLKKFVNEGE